MEIQWIDNGRSQCTNSFIEVQPSCRGFFSFFFQLRKRERARQEERREGGEGSWRKEGADLIFDWTRRGRPVLVKLDLTEKPDAAGLGDRG